MDDVMRTSMYLDYSNRITKLSCSYVPLRLLQCFTLLLPHSLTSSHHLLRSQVLTSLSQKSNSFVSSVHRERS
jgi:hypothetical protein